MDVDANQLVSKLMEQIKQLSLNLAIKDVQIDSLKKELEIAKGN